ncbi:RnfABCDGE type electron transport complex subunit D [Sedimenticola thiotaurini]|uniref:Ion-translocating oxidoreductase complex subunit D n=1 Tax=Sedimenticola thiotaurini TaxID=1543721 RepID=A0A0F7JXE1_9GAMM|nr:RnfABCDGE type electron transport complex subunit D [Sedimenticola thiotaurini]AKH19475.1 electron transporter RnfD [Sedimenticola thiotaurini]
MSRKQKKVVEIRTSPHLKKAISVEQIMRNVVYALLPVCGWSVYQFGLSALVLILVTILSCVLTESLFCRLSGRPNSVGDFSVIITGMLLALTLPPGFPLWMAAVAGFMAIGLGKALFGGLGYNVMNPALVGRAFVQAAFPVAITTWTPGFTEGRFLEFIPSSLALPFMSPVDTADWVKSHAVDGFTGATPLALQKFEHVTTSTMDLLTGSVSGSAGEASALLIFVCGLYLAFRKMMDWRIPAAVFLGAALISGPLHLMNPEIYPSPLFVILSGGLMLGAMFMATDMVISPMTPRGVWLYGIVIGVLTVIIRQFGGLTEGVMYAILVANALSPLIASVTQPRIYGATKKGAES